MVAGSASDDVGRDELLVRVARAVSRSNGHFAVLVDGALTVKWASETVSSVLGWPDVVGRNVIGLIHPDDVELALLGIMHHTTNAEAYSQLDRATMVDPVTVPMAHTGSGEGGVEVFSATTPLPVAGPVGYTVRVLPHNALLAADNELGLVTLA